jgi:hypothetical protein
MAWFFQSGRGEAAASQWPLSHKPADTILAAGVILLCVALTDCFKSSKSSDDRVALYGSSFG